MAKSIANSVLDAALDKVATGTIVTVCNAEPTTYTEATSTFTLADVVTDGTDFTKAAGDTSGRKVTVGQQTDVPIDTTGDATHIAVSNSAGTEVLLVTTCTSQSLTSGGTVTVPAFDYEINAPA